MNRTHWLFGRRWWLAGITLLVAAVGLGGCFRGHWGSPESNARFEAHLDDAQQELASQLEIKPYQQADFDALMAQYREVTRKWRGGWLDTAKEVKQGLEQDPADADAIGAALKQRIEQRPSDEELKRLVDQTVAFYRTLEPQQQQEVRDHLLRHLRRRLG